MKKETETTEALPPTCAAAPKARGRPLSFDRTVALEKAMHVFWERGYEAASIADLTAAMGITPPSLYTAFGDKERLFLETVECYVQGSGSFWARALLEEPTARGAIERLLLEAAAELTQECHPLGCLMVMATTNCSVAAEHVQSALARQRAIDEGELPADADAAALANFFSTVYQGMSMQAKDGASRKSLLASVKMAMRSWPDAPVARAKPAADKRRRRPSARTGATARGASTR